MLLETLVEVELKVREIERESRPSRFGILPGLASQRIGIKAQDSPERIDIALVTVWGETHDLPLPGVRSEAQKSRHSGIEASKRLREEDAVKFGEALTLETAH